MAEKYTCRGTVVADAAAPERITLFDGRFDTGWRIVRFKVAARDIDFTSVRSFAAKLATVSDLNESVWDWGDQREVAWAYSIWDSNLASAPSFYELVDPDQVIVEDLYLYVDEATQEAASICNYFIELEKVEFPEWRGALSLARDAQSD